MQTMRIRIIKDAKKYKLGQVIDVSPNEAFGLIDQGLAEVSKEMTARDYKTSNRFKPLNKGRKA